MPVSALECLPVGVVSAYDNLTTDPCQPGQIQMPRKNVTIGANGAATLQVSCDDSTADDYDPLATLQVCTPTCLAHMYDPRGDMPDGYCFQPPLGYLFSRMP